MVVEVTPMSLVEGGREASRSKVMAGLGRLVG